MAFSYNAPKTFPDCGGGMRPSSAGPQHPTSVITLQGNCLESVHLTVYDSKILRKTEFSGETNNLLFNYRAQILTAMRKNEPSLMYQKQPERKK